MRNRRVFLASTLGALLAANGLLGAPKPKTPLVVTYYYLPG